MDIEGDADINGTLEADAITVGGTALATYIRDTVGTNMLSSNTESGITVTYDTSNDNIDFKTFKSPRGKDPYPDQYEPGRVVQVIVSGKTVEELVTNGQARGLKYIGIPEKGSYFFPFLNDLYDNEENYPYMKKIFDSEEANYEEFKIKAFEIDYKKFHDLNG